MSGAPVGGPPAAGPARVGQASAAPAYRFDPNRWTRTDRISGVATLVVLISLFLPWFTVNLAGLGSGSGSGTDAHGWLWFVFVIGLLLLLYLLVAAGYQRLPVALPLRHEHLLLAATAINFLLVLIGFFVMPSNDGIAGVTIGWDFGAFIALIAAIAAVAAPVRDFAAERKAGGAA
ncbi:MAG TPA: hypothetical protein VKU39_16595 [Streptosporangiaceae bacterium]|nr:hypothetical protein [Streptosporangiaceae bacterium]